MKLSAPSLIAAGLSILISIAAQPEPLRPSPKVRSLSSTMHSETMLQ